MKPIVQVSLDLIDIKEAMAMAHTAMQSGVDWLEAGTPFILAEGLHGVRALRKEFPNTPVVADLKTMDGGYLEAQMMAKAGATHVVVMARAHPETIKVVVKEYKQKTNYTANIPQEKKKAYNRTAYLNRKEKMEKTMDINI